MDHNARMEPYGNKAMETLFSPALRRTALLSFPLPENCPRLVIGVYRNTNFELVASAVNPFLSLSGWQADFHLSAYDDSLSFPASIPRSDVNIIWLDLSCYAADTVRAWLTERISTLALKSRAPLLAACLHWPAGLDEPVLPENAVFMDCGAILENSLPAGSIYDERLSGAAGTGLANAAMLELARVLGSRYLPSLLLPPYKAIVCDVDNTLFHGVIGEDGIMDVSPAMNLQQMLARCGQQGIMLALCTKNDENDVKALFTKRNDLPLGWADFSFVSASWKPKAEQFEDILNFLHILPQDVLFLDDNPGERFNVHRAHPAVSVLEANTPEAMAQALTYYPRLMKPRVLPEDGLRTQDMRANGQREALRESLSPYEYLKQLNVVISLRVNPADQARRARELLNKTNQFVLNYSRPDAEAVLRYSSGSPERALVTASLADRLSDSGVVAVVLVSLAEKRLCFDDVAMSCRAMGRGLDDVLLLALLHATARALHADEAPVGFRYKKGDRNVPGLDWLRRMSGRESLENSGTVWLDRLPALPDGMPVVIRQEK